MHEDDFNHQRTTKERSARERESDRRNEDFGKTFADIMTGLRSLAIDGDQAVSTTATSEQAAAELREYLQGKSLPRAEEPGESFVIGGEIYFRGSAGEGRACQSKTGPAFAFLYNYGTAKLVKTIIVDMPDGFDPLAIGKALLWGELRQFDGGVRSVGDVSDYFGLKNLAAPLLDDVRLRAAEHELERKHKTTHEADSRKIGELTASLSVARTKHDELEKGMQSAESAAHENEQVAKLWRQVAKRHSDRRSVQRTAFVAGESLRESAASAGSAPWSRMTRSAG